MLHVLYGLIQSIRISLQKTSKKTRRRIMYTSVGRSKQKDRCRREEILYFEQMKREAFEKFYTRYKDKQLKILEQLELCRTTISNLPMYLKKKSALAPKPGLCGLPAISASKRTCKIDFSQRNTP